ncbi:MAG TPA: hypothetical protein VJS68_00580 [Thermoplasmata archaeon]|nr:hypothetical protein [Thermoplasmata archaeon]
MAARDRPVMALEAPATDEPSSRKRETWSIRKIAEDLAHESGIEPHHSSYGRFAVASFHPPAYPTTEELPVPSKEELDPVARFSPPLVGPVGRASHDPRHEHHTETIEHLERTPPLVGPGMPAHPPGPSRRPERIYLHYLLLHLDRLSDAALNYLNLAVGEELAQRKPRKASPATEAAADPRVEPTGLPVPVPPASAPG